MADEKILNKYKISSEQFKEESAGAKAVHDGVETRSNFKGGQGGRFTGSGASGSLDGGRHLKRGELSTVDNVLDRPGAALRGGIQEASGGGSFREGYVKGSLVPEEVPRFQDLAIDESLRRAGTRSLAANFAIGMLPSTVGLAGDILTNPAQMLLLIGGKTPLPKGQTIGGTLAKSQLAKSAMEVGRMSPGQALNASLKATRNVTRDMRRIIAKPFPKAMTNKWITARAKDGQKAIRGLDDMIGKAFGTVRGSVKGVKIDPRNVDSVLLKSNLDDIVIKEIDELVGTVDTVEKAYTVTNILQKRVPKALFFPGGATGKGGLTNSKIRAKGTIQGIKDVITASVGQTDPQAALKLKAMDEYGATKLYPLMNKLRAVFGRQGHPETEGIVALKGPGKARTKELLRKAPEDISNMRAYLQGTYKKDLTELSRLAAQLNKDLGKFQSRQSTKALLGYLGKRALGPAIGISIGGGLIANALQGRGGE